MQGQTINQKLAKSKEKNIEILLNIIISMAQT